MELEAREASEDVGVATEDTIARPPGDEDLVASAELSPEIADAPTAPEVADTAAEAGAAAPPEEKEEAEAIAMMSPDSSPEGLEGLEAAGTDPKVRKLDVRLNQEEPDPGASPGETTDALREETTPVAEGQETTDTLEPDDVDGDESLESIVKDLKRERGQE
jgi:hypothetical protein